MFINLQLLRAFAALNVVLFHGIGISASYGYNSDLISYLEGWGANGVDIFFVTSGFVMLYTQLENKRSVKDFLILRAIRIIPLYWLLTLLFVMIYSIAPFVFREMQISVEWALASLAFLSRAVVEKNPIVHPGWTLEWEMLFYLVFGLCLWFRNWITTLSITSVVLLGTAYFVSNFIVVEFIAGLFIAIAYKIYGFKRFGLLSLILGFLLLSLSLFDSIRSLTDNRLILWAVPSILIVYGAIAAPQIDSQVGKLLGDASYSIYLVQVLSIPVFYKILTVSNIQSNNDLLILLCLFFTLIGGVTVYILVERPILNLLKRHIH